ncbi:DNA glycosylase [Chloropicon primus]|nr:DNA glycosylase [Chloropicon primus]|mmetsp:Transcript_6713/g.19658  ORF Transcript_6713/g.19658 Transcript_6713/m.19658 type:complete len:253 (-) Transcript_6713:174-932(-)
MSLRSKLGVRVVKAAKRRGSGVKLSGKGRAHDSTSTSTPDVSPLKHLSDSDDVLRDMIASLGPPTRLLEKPRMDAFTTLVRSIVSQQLSMKAAETIFGRVRENCTCGVAKKVTPKEVLARDFEELRQLGLSGRKVGYVKDLAEHFESGKLSDAKLKGMTGEEVMEALTKVRGLGVWSVQMFQMFFMGSENVLPTGDVAVRRGCSLLYFDGKVKVTPEQLEEIARPWEPYQSYGAYYMWQAKRYLEEKQKLSS